MFDLSSIAGGPMETINTSNVNQVVSTSLTKRQKV